MTPLRQRMIREMQLRQLSPRTVAHYVRAVIGLARFYRRSPDRLSREQGSELPPQARLTPRSCPSAVKPLEDSS